MHQSATVAVEASPEQAASQDLELALDYVREKKTKIERSSYNGTNLIDDMRRFVSFVKRHLTLRLEHSVQLDESEASHC